MSVLMSSHHNLCEVRVSAIMGACADHLRDYSPRNTGISHPRMTSGADKPDCFRSGAQAVRVLHGNRREAKWRS
jgi:hypothetical protein